MRNSTDTETLLQLVSTAARHADKADRNETAIRDLQQDVQYLGTRLGRVERRLDGIDTRLDGMDTRMDSLEAGQQRIEAIVLQILEKLE